MRDPSTQVTIVHFLLQFLSALSDSLHQERLKDTLFFAPYMHACCKQQATLRRSGLHRIADDDVKTTSWALIGSLTAQPGRPQIASNITGYAKAPSEQHYLGSEHADAVLKPCHPIWYE